MSIQIHDYSKMFTRLCSFVALSKGVNIDDTIDRVVISALAFDPAYTIDSLELLAEAILVYFGVSFSPESVDASLARLQANGKILRDETSYYLSTDILAEVTEKNQHATELEEAVRSEWLRIVSVAQPSISEEQQKCLWKALQMYMALAFSRHGAQTIRFLDPNTRVPQDVNEHLPT